MNIDAIRGSMPNYTPQNPGGQNNIAQLEKKLEELNKQLREAKLDDNLAPEKKQEQIEGLEKKIAEIKKRIEHIKQEGANHDEGQPDDVREQELTKKALQNHVLDEYV